MTAHLDVELTGDRPHDRRGAVNAHTNTTPRKSPLVSDAPVFQQYRRTQIAEMTPWTPWFDMDRVSVSDSDKGAGSPKEGDMIARNPKNHADRWLVAADYFADNFEQRS